LQLPAAHCCSLLWSAAGAACCPPSTLATPTPTCAHSHPSPNPLTSTRTPPRPPALQPQWFDDLGGFEREENIPLYVEWCVKAVELFGKRIHFWATFNEPTVSWGGLGVCWVRWGWGGAGGGVRVGSVLTRRRITSSPSAPTNQPTNQLSTAVRHVPGLDHRHAPAWQDAELHHCWIRE